MFSVRSFPRTALGLLRQPAAPEHWLPVPEGPATSVKAARRLVFLTFGPNPSFDYYFAPRLAKASSSTHMVVDTRANHPDATLLRESHVVICRYLPKRWRRALDAHCREISGISLFIDDDYIALASDRSLPFSYRLRVLRDGISLLSGLARMGGTLLVSTEVLAHRYSAFRPFILPPRAPSALLDQRIPLRSEGELRIALHATASHDREHLFVAEVARQLMQRKVPCRFDVIASGTTAACWRDISAVTLRKPLSWPDFKTLTDRLEMDLLLAPLEDTPLNGARAPTKAIDALRLGAAGLFADLPPYWPLRPADCLIGRSVSAWADEIERMARAPDRLALRKAQLKDVVTTWSRELDWPEAWPPSGLLAP